MSAPTITARDRDLAEGCLRCPACKHARKNQRGLLFWFVNKVEGKLCPRCRAYEKVYGRKAHEKISAMETEDYLTQCASREKFELALAQSPDREPDVHDR